MIHMHWLAIVLTLLVNNYHFTFNKNQYHDNTTNQEVL